MSKPFQEMDPDVIRQLIEGQENVIAPAVAREQGFLQGVACPSCGGPTDVRLDVKRPFVQGSILPNKILVCSLCGTELDPRSGIILRSSILPPR